MNKILVQPSRNIRAKTSLFVLFLLIVTIGSSYLITVQILRERILNEVVKRGESLCRSIASTAGYSFINQDILGLDTLVFKVNDSNPDIENIAIIDNNNEIRVHSDINLTGETYTPPDGKIFESFADGTIIKESGRKHQQIRSHQRPKKNAPKNHLGVFNHSADRNGKHSFSLFIFNPLGKRTFQRSQRTKRGEGIQAVKDLFQR